MNKPSIDYDAETVIPHDYVRKFRVLYLLMKGGNVIKAFTLRETAIAAQDHLNDLNIEEVGISDINSPPFWVRSVSVEYGKLAKGETNAKD